MAKAARKGPDFDAMSVDEKIRHVEELWDRIATSQTAIPLPAAQVHELERRLADDLDNPGSGTPWPEVRDRIRSKRK